MQVNFLSHWLLAHELLSKQRNRRARQNKKSARDKICCCNSSNGTNKGSCDCGVGGTRLVLLSSLTHHAGPLNWEDKQVGHRRGLGLHQSPMRVSYFVATCMSWGLPDKCTSVDAAAGTYLAFFLRAGGELSGRSAGVCLRHYVTWLVQRSCSLDMPC